MYTIYGKSDCIFCDKAKELLEKGGLEFQYINVMNSVRAQEMFKDRQFKTVPQIFVGMKHVGGYDDLEKYLSTL